MNHAYMMLPQLKYSIKGWNKQLYNWVFVPNFRAEEFSTFKLKTMLYAKHINLKSKYCCVSDNKMCCPIIFIAKEPPPKKIIDKLMVINI